MIAIPEEIYNSKYEVITICLVYNHEAFLRRCLEGFVSQRTTFPYAVVVHDDCSTDNSVSIIQEYASKYPDIIFPMIETENQYSQDVPILRNLIREIQNKYLAICEGDDYWCNPHKLQKQFDHMLHHPECSMCCHNTITHDLAGQFADRAFFSTSDVITLLPDSLFESWAVHTSSYFWRNDFDIFPEWAGDYWAGDYVMLTNAFAHGKIDVLPDVMSVYNYRNLKGMVVKQVNSDEDKRIAQTAARGQYLSDYLLHHDLTTDVRTMLTSKIKAIKEVTAVEQLIYDLKGVNDLQNGNVDIQWLIDRLNDRDVRDGCICPAPGTENRNAKANRERLFDIVGQLVACKKWDNKSDEFSFVSQLTGCYGRGANYLTDTSSLINNPLNKVKWGINRPLDHVPVVEVPKEYLSGYYEVTVICYSYNHAKYLRECLEGIIMQKTSFPYAVIVHDDCSSDDSASIIKEYASKYPDIVYPILETENMYSQRIDFGYDIITRIGSDYLAFCEGDDKWIDDHKLQKQYDYMKDHSECSLCSHNTVKHDVTGTESDQLFHEWKDIHRLSAKEAFRGWFIHTSSFFIRINKVVFPKWIGRFWFGDYAMLTISYAYGCIDVLPDIMSVYDMRVSNSAVTRALSGQNIGGIRDKSIYLSEYRGRVMYDDNAIDVEIDKVLAEKNRANVAHAFINRIRTMANSDIAADALLEFIKEQMNSDELRDACIPPADLDDETERYMLGIVIDALKEVVGSKKNAIGPNIHFNYIAWIIAQYSGEKRDELLAGIVSDPDNKAGWCLKLDGDPDYRKRVMLQTMNRCVDEHSVDRLQELKMLAVKASSDNDPVAMEQHLTEAAKLNCLDPDVLYMRAYLYYAQGRYADALDECGIYKLFYGDAQDLDELVSAVMDEWN